MSSFFVYQKEKKNYYSVDLNDVSDHLIYPNVNFDRENERIELLKSSLSVILDDILSISRFFVLDNHIL